VIEVNLRASRTFPFISKVTGVNFTEVFVDTLFQETVVPIALPPLTFTAVKAPQFSFSRLSGADPILRVEMASTGEVACFGEDVEEAYLKAIIATGGKVPASTILPVGNWTFPCSWVISSLLPAPIRLVPCPSPP